MKPFLKWPGGKAQLLPELLARVPEKYGTYHEPFLGGGALFFALLPQKAVLSDVNPRLINCYKAVRDNCSKVIEQLRRRAQDHRHDPESNYYHVREVFNSPHYALYAETSDVPSVSDAARFIYLNKTCFNGLWRVNRSGEFNVPAGRYKNPTICDEENLRAASAALQNAELICGDFERGTPCPNRGDFWYADPPYVPLSKTADFTAYTKDGFTLDDQRRLSVVARNLKAVGVTVMLSNSFVPEVVSLYPDFTVRTVEARRAINSKGDRRGAVQEAIIS